MSSESPSDLAAKYDAAFIFPFAKHSWKTRRAESCWVDLEGWIDHLAGPVSNIVKYGDCAYVYTRNDKFISGINNPTELYAWFRRGYEGLIAGLNDFVPSSREEEADLASMHQFAAEIWVVVEQAIEIERTRWDSVATQNH